MDHSLPGDMVQPSSPSIQLEEMPRTASQHRYTIDPYPNPPPLSIHHEERSEQLDSQGLEDQVPPVVESLLGPSHRDPDITAGNKTTLRDAWAYETMSTIISICCTVSLSVIFWGIDGKPLSAWAFPIKLNTILSLLGAMMKATVAFSVGQSISQLKWLHFCHDSYQLIELQRFENAGRGPWGSLMFFWNVRLGRPFLAYLLCFIMMIASALEPFTQQTIAYPSRMVLSPNEQALVPVALGYNRGHRIAVRGSESAPNSITSCCNCIKEALPLVLCCADLNT